MPEVIQYERCRTQGFLFARALGLTLFLWCSVALGDAPSLRGNLVSIGSDTLGSLTAVWAELLMRRHPEVLVQVRAVGSGAAPTALIEGTAGLGPMSRPMSQEEERAFIQRYGYAPTAVTVARDSLALFVHRDNPLERIDLLQLDRIFSITRRCGAARGAELWGAVLRGQQWSQRPISLYGRGTASGTYSFFRRRVLCSGDFSPRLNRLVGSSAVVRAVSGDAFGIGYASAGYLNQTVKRLRVTAADGVQDVALSRDLFLYLNKPPASDLDPVVAGFLRLALSEEGQREVRKSGYVRVPESEMLSQLQSLGLSSE